MTKIRISDVANHAKVSKSTVSQYLNGRFSHMSQETKERVKSSIKELNYVPNPIARSLKTDSTKTIGVVVRDVAGFNTAKVLRGIDDFCKARKYNVFIYNTDFNPETEREAFLNLKEMRVDGLIVTSSGRNDELIEDIVKQGIPVVQFQLEHKLGICDTVQSNYYQAAYQATEYLIGLGHKRIAFLTQSFRRNNSRKERYRGYVDALKKYGVPFDESLIYYWDRLSGFETSPQDILNGSNPPTAFFSQHFALTTDVLKDLNESAFSIPKDVSLLGFDELPMNDFFKVPITVIKQEPYTIGEQSAKLLFNKIKYKSKKIQKVVIDCQLVVRESCIELCDL